MRQIAQQVYQENQTQTQFSANKVGVHTHNGVDSQRISQGSIIVGQKFCQNVQITSGLATVNVVSNPTGAFFNGFAANNDPGPTTKRVLVNGIIQFGNCSNGVVGQNLDNPPSSGLQTSFAQGSNSIFIDQTDLTRTRVSASDDYFIYAVDQSGSIVVSATVISFDGNSFTINATVASGWTLTGVLTVTQ